MQIDRVGMGDMLLKMLAEGLVTWWWLIAAVLVLGILLQFASSPRSRRSYWIHTFPAISYPSWMALN